MDELLHQVMTALRGMWRRRWIGLAVAWAVALIGAIVLLRIPDRYEATARVYVDTQTVLKPLMSGLAVQPNVEEQISMLARTLIARPNIEKIVRSTDLDITATTQIEKDRLVDSVTQRIKFVGVGRENIYSISYQDVNADRAKRVVQDLLSLFVESGVGNKRRDSEAARRFIDEQIKGYEKKLEEAENRLKDYKIKNVGFTGNSGQDYFTRDRSGYRLVGRSSGKIFKLGDRLRVRVSNVSLDERRVDFELAGTAGEPRRARRPGPIGRRR